ncbi:protein of unknown function [Beijerinckiaceae bacterium RH AL1]|jgi:hypothetical protein|nr:hypothetical protein [Beijerinckiaceae bacterium]VVB47909.1 protein of unknown function [Beijerinckiaceae bacterium RH CH11]VVB47986.1 protein of unknown function [Beijerinckiaceae bacterium RH AL8]VVC56126.1 protein of unknown function [Beijerinckiaceae bacterium RH AL1]
MTGYDTEQREFETRKLEALSAISVAIATLGSGLTQIVKENTEQGQLLRSVDRKVDRLADMVGALGKLQ